MHISIWIHTFVSQLQNGPLGNSQKLGRQFHLNTWAHTWYQKFCDFCLESTTLLSYGHTFELQLEVYFVAVEENLDSRLFLDFAGTPNLVNYYKLNLIV